MNESAPYHSTVELLELDIQEIEDDNNEREIFVVENNCFHANGMVYRARSAIAKLLDLSEGMVTKRIAEYKIEGIVPINRKAPFFPVELASQACQDLLEARALIKETIANNDSKNTTVISFSEDELGKLQAYIKEEKPDAVMWNGKEYIKRIALEEQLGISTMALKNHLKNRQIEQIPLTINVVYLDKIEAFKQCEKWLLPKVDSEGFVEGENGKLGTIKAWSIELDISKSAIERKINKYKPTPIIGLNAKNYEVNLYLGKDIQEICSDLLEELPKADDTGFFIQNGKKYGIGVAWASEIDLDDGTISKRVKKHNISHVKGRDSLGRIQKFYSQTDIYRICEDIMQDLPKADKNGFFIINGKKYGTTNSWSTVINVTQGAIWHRVDKKHAIKGKDSINKVSDFYEESYVRECCADLIEDLPKADESGFFTLKGIKYGTLRVCAKELNLDYASTVSSRAEVAGLNPIKGRTSNNHLADYYDFKEVKKCCADILCLEVANKSGSIDINNKRYSLISSLSRTFGVGMGRMTKILSENDIDKIEGRDQIGRIFSFYCESEVRKYCKDIIEKQEKEIEDLITNEKLPKFRVIENSQFHKGLSGDVIMVIPKYLKAIYNNIFTEFGIKCEFGQIIGIVNGRPVVINENELVPLLHKPVALNKRGRKKKKNRIENSFEVINRLVTEYCALPEKIFHRKFFGYRHIQNDLIQEGCIGLTMAAKTYNEEKGNFQGYASLIIRQYMQKYLIDNFGDVNIKAGTRKMMWDIQKFCGDFMKKKGRRPTVKEIAEGVNMKIEQVEKLRLKKAESITVSLDAQVGVEDGNGAMLHELVADEQSLKQMIVKENTSQFEEMMKFLAEEPKRVQEVIKLRFGLNGCREHTLEEVGKIFEVTRERIRQIEKKFLNKAKKNQFKKAG